MAEKHTAIKTANKHPNFSYFIFFNVKYYVVWFIVCNFARSSLNSTKETTETNGEGTHKRLTNVKMCSLK